MAILNKPFAQYRTYPNRDKDRQTLNMSNTLLIWNRGAGNAPSLSELQRRFSPERTDIVEITRSLNLVERVTEAAQGGCELVIAAGGDGTVNAVVNALMRLEAARRPRLAILPIGTANDFAATLALSLEDLDRSIEQLCTAPCVPIDVVRIRAENFERYYANIAAGGNSVRVAEAMTDEMKARWGAYCYLRGGLEVLNDLQSFRITVDCGGESFEDLGAWAVLVANGKVSAGGVVVAPGASPVDGLLDVIIIRDGTMLDIVDLVSNAVLGSYLESEQVIHRQVPYLTLQSEPGMRFSLDGEVIDEEPVHFEIEPGAISMYVGTEFVEEHQLDVEKAQHWHEQHRGE